MPKSIVKGVGMMAHEVEVFDLRSDDPQEREGLLRAFERFAEVMPISEQAEPLGQALRRENAERCRRILADVGIEDTGKAVIDKRLLLAKGLGEDTRPWIAAEWLAAYHGLCRNIERLKSDGTTPDILGTLLMYAEDLGRLQERMWWRAGVDTSTAKRREALALRGRKHTRPNAGQQGRTAERMRFLDDLAREIGTRNHVAMAAEAVKRKRVEKLWPAAGERAHVIIMNFLRNHPLP